MTNGQMWVIAILGILIFFAVASVASNITNLIKAVSSPPTEPKRPRGLVEFGVNSEFGHIFVNPANVTHLSLLTGEGGTAIHLLGGGSVSVYDNLKVVAERLGLP